MKIDFKYQDKVFSLHAKDGDYIGQRVRGDGTFYEVDMLEAIAMIGLPAGAIAFDVGANIGNHTVYFAAVLGMDVVAVEPDSQNGEFLRLNIAENGISQRVGIAECALGEHGGRAHLIQQIPGNSGTFSMVPDEHGLVEVQTLDQLASGRPVGLIKIDVEGHEVEVLKGAMDTLKRHHPVVTTESHSGGHFAAISDLLSPLGYSVVDIAGRSDNVVWIHDEAMGSLRAANIREGIELHRLRNKFRQVYVATDRISNMLKEGGKASVAWQEKVDLTLSSIVESSEKLAGRPDLSVYWKTLVDMIAEMREHGRQSDERMATFRHDLSGLHAQFPRELEHLRLSILRGVGRQIDANSRLDDAVAQLVGMITGSETRTSQALARIETAISDDSELLTRDYFNDTVRRMLQLLSEDRGYVKQVDFADGMHRLEQALEGTVREESFAEVRDALAVQRDLIERSTSNLEQALGAALKDSMDGGASQLGEMQASLSRVVGALTDRRAELAQRELDINDVTQKLAACHELLRALTGEVVQARADREQMIDSYQSAKRSALAQSFAAKEWEGAYRILHGSRALRMARAFRAFAGKPQPAHDVSARSVQITSVVSDHMRAVGMLENESLPVDLRKVTKPLRRRRETVRAGIATMPGRESGLSIVLDSLCPQVDEVYVYLNGFDVPPDCVFAHDNVHAFVGPDVGDRGKFRFVDGYSGYFISVDDDIAYPDFYVQTLIDGIERYGRRAAVGWHGSILLDGFSDYYDAKSRRVLTFGSERGADTQVHVLGTGCTAFHTDTIRVSYGDFLKPNMADIFFALEGQRQQVPFMVLAHRKGWATPIEFKSSPSISGESMKSSGSRIDVRATTNALVKTQGKWKMPVLPAPDYARAPFTLALIGRTDKDRWKKGGILKSSHLTKKMLDPYGVTTHLIDIEKGDVEGLGGANPHVVMIYPGDPDRPDYAKVEYLVDFHASLGRVVLVNLSLNSVARRSDFVCGRIAEWRKVHGEKVWLMTFTDRAKDLGVLAPVADAIFAVPKTIEVPSLRVRSFSSTEGIFLGDYGKLCDDGLLGFPAEEVISALRTAIPGAPLFAVKQYAPKSSRDFGIRVLPYLSEDYADTLRSTRLMVNLVKFATFEMVPAELAGMGVPIVHPRMSFSLSDYLGLSAFEVETVEDLARTASVLYSDPMAWGAASASSELRGASADFRVLSAQMYIKLLGLAGRAAL